MHKALTKNKNYEAKNETTETKKAALDRTAFTQDICKADWILTQVLVDVIDS